MPASHEHQAGTDDSGAQTLKTRGLAENMSREALFRRALLAADVAAIIESRGRADWRFTSPLLRPYLAGVRPYD